MDMDNDNDKGRNAQVDEGSSFVGIGTATVKSSRSVDSLSNHLGAKTETCLSPAISPRPEIEELKNLHLKIAKLKQKLDIRVKEVEELREEKESMKPVVCDRVEELDKPEISSCTVGSQPICEGATHDRSCNEISELICNKNLLDEVQNKYDQCEIKYEAQRLENLHLKKQFLQLEADVNHWKEAYEKLRIKTDADQREWKRFQDDLLTVVRAANDFKTEAQEKCEAIEIENVALREKISILETNSKSVSETLSLRRRVVENSLPLLTESKSNKRELADVIEEVQLLEMATMPSSKGKDEITPLPTFENNKENCDANGYSNQLEFEAKAQQNVSTKRGIGPAFLNTKKSEMWNGSFDHDDDPLVSIVKVTGSRRNALLRWCQSRTAGYKHVEITNFSTSWSNGMALCALLHSYLPDHIPYDSLTPENSEQNFNIAFKAAESVAVLTTLSMEEMVSNERPSWEKVMNYVKDIYMKLGSCDLN